MDKEQQQIISEMTQTVFKFYPLIRKSFRSLVSIKDLPITTTQLSCLYAIQQQGSMTMSILAKKMQISNQQLTKIVDHIASLELVTRCADPSNRRQLLVSITPKGAKLLSKLNFEVVKKLTIISSKVPSEEIRKIYDSMSFLEKYFDKLSNLLDGE